MIIHIVYFLSPILAFESAIFIFFASVGYTPKNIADYSSTRIGYNKSLVEYLSHQYSYNMVSLVYLCLSFTIQFIGLGLGLTYELDIFIIFWSILISIFLFLLGFFYVRKLIYPKCFNESKRILDSQL